MVYCGNICFGNVLHKTDAIFVFNFFTSNAINIPENKNIYFIKYEKCLRPQKKRTAKKIRNISNTLLLHRRESKTPQVHVSRDPQEIVCLLICID